MSKKQLIHAYVEPDVYLQLKAKDINLSRTVNQLLKSFLHVGESDKEEEVLKDQLRAAQEEKQKVDDKVNSLAVELYALQAQKEQEQKEWLENAMQMQEAMHLNNPMRDL